MDKPGSAPLPHPTTPHGTMAANSHRTHNPPQASAQVRLTGELERATPLTVADLRAMPQHTMPAKFLCGRLGAQRHEYTGTPLLGVLLAARPRFDPAVRKDRVRFLVTVTGRDGHLAVLSWAEIDPQYGDTTVLLATSVDHHHLDTQGPQLVVPGDAAGGRYVSQITTIWVGPAIPTRPPTRR
ncbi:molybdopterin-dependent oxidoreductase [Actinomadura syzygii]|uniref:Uncharacterized protein n=1 Tax=Actinomadura syzygii TaxID=1427538 RepID=A0A5D0TY06_9ACTN|nr:molybdopterin-dependent oxidoreductase [Actinomadura syzygii]TYC11211.1 hypothetical protein FXF65_30190 [Actinomadura syzygii]